ncbi:putative ORFan [Tupanvirus deep ocean]|uniref:ORFan n=2 Tax=Tupanvirus TaxID=2094720 RepID=A0AC62A9T2_9VIRU|nr:putative ORFan [Tupanvirus deep ocean]QKU34443.1 putative ORFan [Tupanvirus deep ocean]
MESIIIMGVLNNLLVIIKSPNFYVPIILAGILIVVGNLYQSTVQAKMKTVLFHYAGIHLDWWSVTHILLYIYFGYHFPDYFVEFLIIGTSWEIVESVMCKDSVQSLIKCDNLDSLICQIISKIKGCDYWYGKLDDIVMNMFGFLIGAWLSKKFKK